MTEKRRKPTKFLHKPPAKARVLYKGWHDETYQEDCPVCQFGKKAALEALYMRAYKVSELASISGLEADKLRDHFAAIGLTDKRANNTDAFYARVIDLGMEFLDPADITPEMLIKALWRKDKLNGRDIERVEHLRPTKIIIMAPPQTGDLADKPITEEAKIDKGEAVRALGPADTLGTTS